MLGGSLGKQTWENLQEINYTGSNLRKFPADFDVSGFLNVSYRQY